MELYLDAAEFLRGTVGLNREQLIKRYGSDSLRDAELRKQGEAQTLLFYPKRPTDEARKYLKKQGVKGTKGRVLSTRYFREKLKAWIDALRYRQKKRAANPQVSQEGKEIATTISGPCYVPELGEDPFAVVTTYHGPDVPEFDEFMAQCRVEAEEAYALDPVFTLDRLVHWMKTKASLKNIRGAKTRQRKAKKKRGSGTV